MLKEFAENNATNLPTQPVQSAKAVGLRYVTDELPGIRRQKAGGGFRYLDANGKVSVILIGWRASKQPSRIRPFPRSLKRSSPTWQPTRAKLNA